MKMVEKHIRKVASTHQKDWDKRLPIYPCVAIVQVTSEV
jgi:hypothetical protein